MFFTDPAARRVVEPVMRDCLLCEECEFYQFDSMLGDTPICTCGHSAYVHLSQQTQPQTTACRRGTSAPTARGHVDETELRAIVEGRGIEPGGTNIPLIQAMARELLEARKHQAMCIHCSCDFCKESKP
jgi:hypothetical protein